jgi:hypothetical protein
MPRVNVNVLLTHLNALHMALYAIWTECRNYELCDDLMRQIKKVEALIGTLEPLSEPVCLIKDL